MTSEIVLRHHDFLMCIAGESGTRPIVSNCRLNPGATNDYVETALGLTLVQFFCKVVWHVQHLSRKMVGLLGFGVLVN